MATTHQVSDALTRIQRQLRTEFEVAVKRVVATRTTEEALELTKLSDHSLRDLAKLDHPYAQRHAANTLHDDRLIHRQSGDLQSSFRDSVHSDGETVIYTLRNEATYWPYLRDGTPVMRQRAMPELLKERFVQDIWPEFVNACRVAWRQMASR